ncbi:hypothetical protein EPICR_50143 [Candidatus Desulfarcum epimagneticum]|uniref:Uncharacterized protein n=1 Tax=uncultured Desulfobacteraceae bacterium TaxID=218296 RepID=A0A484HPT1_9BACT|nr:hypothetical protein EPICR_50143 [uncultured Desulfobacteraceae bacterium]
MMVGDFHVGRKYNVFENYINETTRERRKCETETEGREGGFGSMKLPRE